MTNLNQTTGVLEFKQTGMSYWLHRDGQASLKGNRQGAGHLKYSWVPWSQTDRHWIVDIPAAEANQNVETSERQGWSVAAEHGNFIHPSKTGQTWTPTSGTRTLITESLPEGSAEWIGDHLAVNREGKEALNRLLLNLGASVPWSRGNNEASQQNSDLSETDIQEKLRGINPRLAELTRRLGELRVEVTQLTDEEAKLQKRRDKAKQDHETAKAEAEPLQAEVSRLKQEEELLLKRKQELEDELNASRQFLERYRLYRETRGPAGSHEPLREARWLPGDEADALVQAMEAVQTGGRQMAWTDLLTLHVSLLHAPFTILQGNPGAGKTSILQLYGHHLGMLCGPPIAVNPAWMTQEDILGHYDMISQTFVEGDLGRILLEHHPINLEEQRRVRLAILDEINLVTVEHVFASLMSALALDDVAQQRIVLHRASQNEGGPPLPPQELVWPAGLVLAGTANNDHTVVAFSDRFRDRSAVHTLLALDQATILDSLDLSLSKSVQQPAERDLPQDTWESWKEGRAWRAAGVPDAIRETIRTFVEKLGTGSVSPRSLRRGTVMACHAYHLLDSIEERAPHLSGEIQAGGAGERDDALFAASLGLLPTLLQRNVRLHKNREERQEAIEALRQAVHPTFHTRLDALRD